MDMTPLKTVNETVSPSSGPWPLVMLAVSLCGFLSAAGYMLLS